MNIRADPVFQSRNYVTVFFLERDLSFAFYRLKSVAEELSSNCVSSHASAIGAVSCSKRQNNRDERMIGSFLTKANLLSLRQYFSCIKAYFLT